MLKLCLSLPWLIELCVNNWKYNAPWGFCHFILSCDSCFVKSRTKVKTNLHIAVLKKLKSSTAKTITCNDVFSPSWYKGQVTKKLWLMYRLCKVFIDQRSNSSLHRITWNAFRKLIIFIKISYTSAIFFFFHFCSLHYKSIQGYLSCVLVSRGCVLIHSFNWAEAVRSKSARTQK